MFLCPVILAQQDNGSQSQLFYVIAVLILSALGALAEKLKQRRERQAEGTMREKMREKMPPKPPVGARPERAGEPLRPAKPRPVPPTGSRERTVIVVERPARPPTPPRRVPTAATAPTVPTAPPLPPVPPARPSAPTLSPERSLGESAPLSALARMESDVSARSQAVPAAGMPSTRLGPPLTPAELRRAVVLNELLQPPLALREPI